MRIGVLTGGGDCPGLNAAIRAVVHTAAQEGDEVVGFRDGWRGVIEDDAFPIDPDRCRDIHILGGTILGTSRTNPSAIDGGHRARPGHPLSPVGGRVGRDRRGGHPRRGAPARTARRPGGGCPQDHRQRPLGDRGDVWLRHCGPDRHGGDRSTPDHRGVASPGHRLRGDGPARRLDRRPRGDRRGRRRDPRARDPLRPRPALRPPPTAASARPVLVDRGGRRGRRSSRRPRRLVRRLGRVLPAARPVWSRPPRRHRRVAGGARSSSGPATRPASPPSATSSGVGRRRPWTGCSPPALGSRRSGPSARGGSTPWSPSRPARSCVVPLADAVSAPKTLDLRLLDEVAAPFLG